VSQRPFDAGALPLADDELVTTFSPESYPTDPDVSAAGDGRFVVVWASGCYVGDACSLDGSGYAIALQRFDAAGIPDGPEQIANTSTLGTIGLLEDGGAPRRRCRSGRRLGRARATLAPGSDTNLLLALTARGARCLEADADGALPIDVTVRVRRRKVPLSEVAETRVWRRQP
jgi:hypothetical protein